MDIQWPLALFSLLAGCGGGMLAFLAISEVRSVGNKARVPLAIASLVAIILGGCASVAHLGNPSNIMAAAANIGSFSGISVELICLGLAVIAGGAYVYSVKRGISQTAVKSIAIVAGVLGVALAFVTGNGYVMEAQPNWNTVALPLCYLASGLAMGGTVCASGLVHFGEDDIPGWLRPMLVAVFAVEAIAFVCYDAAIGFVAPVLVFWVCALGVGVLASAACVIASKAKAQLMLVAALCSIVGGLAIRVSMWLVGSGYLDLLATIAARSVLGM